MSVLIKGMKKPYGCLACPLQKWEMCGASGLNVTTEIALQKRRADCPLIEVPTPHGRLIDADALKLKKYHSTKNMENAVAIAEIDWMPTVIGAEN